MQLEILFDDEQNRFRENIRSGDFNVFIEIDTPTTDVDIDKEAEKLAEYELIISSFKNLSINFAINDKIAGLKTHSPVDFINKLSQQNRDKHIIYLSGRNLDLGRLFENIHSYELAGFRNFVAVSGNAFYDKNIDTVKQNHFMESVHILNEIKNNSNSKLTMKGAVINPFKYTTEDLFTQYYKLIKKINYGADFIVSQFGWDMKKLHEVVKYLSFRGIHTPLISRQILLKPNFIENLRNDKLDGIHISPDFRKILENELRFSHIQFEAAQWRRLQISIAGAKLMGFSGIQVAGLTDERLIKVGCLKIEEALEEFTSFEEWKEVYLDYTHNTTMAPYPNNYYIFKNILEDIEPEKEMIFIDSSIKQPSLKEQINFQFSKKLFSTPKLFNKIIKNTIIDCQNCEECCLHLTEYICPFSCPKGFANGSCGETQANGDCEFRNTECIHSVISRVALWQNNIHKLEEELI